MQPAAEWSLACSDAGSEFCPCYLGLTGECFVCSLLRGEEFCSCSWSGACSYLNYHWSHGSVHERLEQKVEVEKEELTPNLTVFRLFLSPELFRELSNPGAFLFLRRPGSPPAAAVPVSVIDVTPEGVWLVVYADGPKTRLLADAGPELVVRGPYYNGVQGVAALKGVRSSLALIIAGGVGQSTTVLTARQLVRGDNRVKACLAPGRAGRIYVADTLRRLGVEVTEVESLRYAGLDWLKNWLAEQPALVMSGGPDSLHQVVGELVAASSGKPQHVWSQNSIMCCGDGLCGSCVTYTPAGRRVPRCKSQFQVAERR